MIIALETLEFLVEIQLHDGNSISKNCTNNKIVTIRWITNNSYPTTHHSEGIKATPEKLRSPELVVVEKGWQLEAPMKFW